MARARAGRRLAAVVALLLVAGCSGPATARSSGAAKTEPWSAFDGGRVVSSWSADGGRFRVVPTDGSPAVTATRMARRLASSDVGDTMAGQIAWGYGRVSIDGRTAMAGTPAFRHRDAWVVVLGGFLHGCPMLRPNPTPPAESPGYTVLVLDGTGTSGAVYSSASTTCEGRINTRPQARPLTEVDSLPWTLVRRRPGGIEVSVEVPPCAVDVGTQGTGYDKTLTESWQVVATRNVVGPQCATEASRPSTVQVTFLSSRMQHLEHGVVGLRGAAGPDTTGAQLMRLVASR